MQRHCFESNNDWEIHGFWKLISGTQVPQGSVGVVINGRDKELRHCKHKTIIGLV